MEPGRPSETARWVAAQRRTFERAPGMPDGDPGADEVLAGDVAGELAVDPTSTMAAYLRGRSAFFDAAVLRAIDDGIGQIAIIGAGYDGRALRYRTPGVRWFEVDHPATQADKVTRLARLGLDASDVTFVPADLASDLDLATVLDTAGLRADGRTLILWEGVINYLDASDVTFVPADLASDLDLATVLDTAGLRADGRTLILWEGVVNYLDAEAVAATAAALRRASGPNSILAVSVATEATPQARARFERQVGAMGEAAAAPIDVDAAQPLLAEAGWTMVRPAGPDDARLRRAGLVLAVATDPAA